jgi:hypothetical protein
MKHTEGNNLNDNSILEDTEEHPKVTQNCVDKTIKKHCTVGAMNSAHGSPYVDVIIKVRSVNHCHGPPTTQHILGQV